MSCSCVQLLIGDGRDLKVSCFQFLMLLSELVEPFDDVLGDCEEVRFFFENDGKLSD